MKVQLTFELSEGSTSNISKLPEMTTYQYIPLLPGRNTGRGRGGGGGGEGEKEKAKEGRGGGERRMREGGRKEKGEW